jgi:hypothetical protein
MNVPINILILLGFLFISACSNHRTPEEMEAAVSRSEILQRVDKLCLEMPKPNDFRFVDKQFSGNSITASISFYYRSNKSTEEMQAFYEQWAIGQDWKLIEEMERTLYSIRYYEKGKQTIAFQFQGIEGSNDANVAIACQEKRK